MSAINPRPPFESLPWRHGDPPFSAWGLYGNDDQIGTLNLLTPERTKAAASEIQTGVRISLDPPINVLSHPLGDRKELVQEIVQRGEGRPVHDDVLTFNTQVRITDKAVLVFPGKFLVHSSVLGRRAMGRFPPRHVSQAGEILQ